jgi:hypothetical protein
VFSVNLNYETKRRYELIVSIECFVYAFYMHPFVPLLKYIEWRIHPLLAQNKAQYVTKLIK